MEKGVVAEVVKEVGKTFVGALSTLVVGAVIHKGIMAATDIPGIDDETTGQKDANTAPTVTKAKEPHVKDSKKEKTDKPEGESQQVSSEKASPSQPPSNKGWIGTVTGAISNNLKENTFVGRH